MLRGSWFCSSFCLQYGQRWWDPFEDIQWGEGYFVSITDTEFVWKAETKRKKLKVTNLLTVWYERNIHSSIHSHKKYYYMGNIILYIEYQWWVKQNDLFPYGTSRSCPDVCCVMCVCMLCVLCMCCVYCVCVQGGQWWSRESCVKTQIWESVWHLGETENSWVWSEQRMR